MMGFIPMNNLVTIISNSGLDEWGEHTSNGTEIEYKARIDYSIRNQVISGAKGNEIVISAKVILQGLVNVSYSDTVKFTDRLGNIRALKPLNIILREDLGGNVLFTVLEV
ncbi:MAG: hypothetical protein K0S71_331 [Clostridia bacterium]|jgi:beta-glucanase (GH16 family)|nr:hypothetical protein [Clostridia bacterium]